MSDRFANARSEAADCVVSLCKAIQEAGGTIHRGHLNMTLRDFISTVAAQNGIRFTYERNEEGRPQPTYKHKPLSNV